jgi:hypothetical protein
MKKIITASAIAMLFSVSAFAQSSALDVRKTFSTLAGDDVSIVDMFMDENGKDRDDADFNMRMTKMTPDQVKMATKACTDAEQQKLGFSDMVMSRCKAITTAK